MRPKVIIGWIVLPTIIVLLAILIKLKSEKPATPSKTVSSMAASNNSSPTINNSSFVNTSIQMPVVSIPIAPTNDLSPEERRSQINAEIDRLNNAYVIRDAASKALIMSDLTNSEPEIRAAALEATKQLGDRSLIPVLQTLATNTADYEEHHALLAAADFLSLPTMEEQTNWTPGPNAIPDSTVRQNRHHPHHPSAPTLNTSDNSTPPASDQPNAAPSAPTTGN